MLSIPISGALFGVVSGKLIETQFYMRYYLIKVVFFSLIVYSATAQSVLSLLDKQTTTIESFNKSGELTGSGTLTFGPGVVGYHGTLRNDDGQTMEYTNHYNFKNTSEGLELSLRFYLNPFTYAPDLDVNYEGGTVVLPATPSAGQTLPDVSGTYTFSVNGKPFITERAKLTNRKVLGTEEVEFRGIKGTAYIIGSTYEAERIHTALTNKSTDEIKEWYIPGTGIVKAERKNNNKFIIFRLK